MLFPVILCGGSGSRLWPLSRPECPKQFLPLVSDKTLFQETVSRVQQLGLSAAPSVICHRHHEQTVEQQFEALLIHEYRMILEPTGKNTCPAAVIAALQIQVLDEDANILLLPADHLIKDLEAFREAVYEADAVAQQGYLVTFGMLPDFPHAGYGYIQQAKGLKAENSDHAYRVERFVEKPDRTTAAKYLSSGDYLWNSGMFVLPVKIFLEEVERLAPDVLAACRQTFAVSDNEKDRLRLDEPVFEHCPSVSIDYAVMEKTDKAAVVRWEMGWSDVGSWNLLMEALKKPGENTVSSGNVFLHEVKNSYLNSQTGKTTVALGVENVVVVETDQYLLVMDRQWEQELKSVIAQL